MPKLTAKQSMYIFMEILGICPADGIPFKRKSIGNSMLPIMKITENKKAQNKIRMIIIESDGPIFNYTDESIFLSINQFLCINYLTHSKLWGTPS
jgi:hypothetical protein